MIAAPTSATAPAAPGRLGQAIAPLDAVRYLERARARGATSARASSTCSTRPLCRRADQSAYTGDMLLSMALWKAVADRYDLLVATWDSGRVGQAEQERLSTLVWGRLDATRHLPTQVAMAIPT